jgi:hypothetical protein
MKRRSHRNPTENATIRTMWRSVSPDEMVDVITSGRIRGRGNAFARDERDYVFFGIDGPVEVMHHGEDTARQVGTRPEWNRRLAAARLDPSPRAVDNVFYAIDAEARRERAEYRDKYGATSFILELSDVPGGTWFHGGESRDGRDEVGFARRPGVSTRHVTKVYTVLDRSITGKTTLDGAAAILGIGSERESVANPPRRPKKSSRKRR